jgi:hypothetical protein
MFKSLTKANILIKFFSSAVLQVLRFLIKDMTARLQDGTTSRLLPHTPHLFSIFSLPLNSFNYRWQKAFELKNH